jgi:hypothetical protein
MRGSRNKIPSKKSPQATLRGSLHSASLSLLMLNCNFINTVSISGMPATLHEGPHSYNFAHRVSIMEVLYTSIRKWPGLNLGFETLHTLTARFCSFSPSLSMYGGTLPLLLHDRLLPNPFLLSLKNYHNIAM